jgi:hypothetical protein
MLSLLAPKYDPKKIKKIFLIPSKDISIAKINQIHKMLTYDAETIIVRFNQNNLTNSKLFPGLTDIRFIRGHGLGRHLTISYKLLGETSKDAFYIANNEVAKDLEMIKKSNGLEKVFSFGQLNIVWDYPSILTKFGMKIAYRGKGPSIGLIAIFNMIDIFPDARFYLLDFTFEGTCMHDMKLEKRICTETLKDRITVV